MEQISTGASESGLPFSEAIRHGDTVYVSGQGPLDPDTGAVVGETPGAQVDATLDNVERILAEAGSSLDRIVQVTVYLDDMADYEAVNEAYAARLSEPYPARTAVEVADLPVDIDVELAVVAAV